MAQKSAELIPQIIEANTLVQAVEVIQNTLKLLYLTTSYTEIVGLQDILKTYEEEYRKISDVYRSLEQPRSYEDIHAIRIDLNFLFRDISDTLSFDVNRLKIWFEETKTVQRGNSMKNLLDNEEVQAKFKAKTSSSLRDIVGLDGDYVEHTSCQSISYGLYQNLANLLNSIRQMIDSISSEERREMIILQKDVK